MSEEKTARVGATQKADAGAGGIVQPQKRTPRFSPAFTLLAEFCEAGARDDSKKEGAGKDGKEEH